LRGKPAAYIIGSHKTVISVRKDKIYSFIFFQYWYHEIMFENI